MNTSVDKIQKASCCVVWFSAFVGHTKLDLYVGKYRLSVIFHFFSIIDSSGTEESVLCYSSFVLHL